MFKIPFSWTPLAWFMPKESDTYRKAKLEYYYSGEELERRLIEEFNQPGSQEFRLQKLEHDLKWERISHLEYEKRKLEILHDMSSKEYRIGMLRLKRIVGEISEYDLKVAILKEEYHENSETFKLKLLDVEREFDKITQLQYEKDKATIQGTPFFKIVDGRVVGHPGDGGIEFEFEWNDYFINELREAGWEGITDDQVVENWFSDACRQIASEELGDFPPPIKDNL